MSRRAEKVEGKRSLPGRSFIICGTAGCHLRVITRDGPFHGFHGVWVSAKTSNVLGPARIPEDKTIPRTNHRSARHEEGGRQSARGDAVYPPEGRGVSGLRPMPRRSCEFPVKSASAHHERSGFKGTGRGSKKSGMSLLWTGKVNLGSRIPAPSRRVSIMPRVFYPPPGTDLCGYTIMRHASI